MSSWDEYTVQRLKSLWPAKTSVEISKILGVTKNAVMGKIHRLGLERKANSPIPAPPPPPSPPKVYPENHCQWLFGEPKKRNFCENVIVRNFHKYPYCSEHYAQVISKGIPR